MAGTGTWQAGLNWEFCLRILVSEGGGAGGWGGGAGGWGGWCGELDSYSFTRDAWKVNGRDLAVGPKPYGTWVFSFPHTLGQKLGNRSKWGRGREGRCDINPGPSLPHSKD